MTRQSKRKPSCLVGANGLVLGLVGSLVLVGVALASFVALRAGSTTLASLDWLWSTPSDAEVVRYRWRLRDEGGSPVSGATVVSEAGAPVATSDTQGVVAFEDVFGSDSWFIKPALGDLLTLDPQHPVRVLQGRWVTASADVRKDWLSSKKPVDVVLVNLAAGFVPNDSTKSKVPDPWAGTEPWSQAQGDVSLMPRRLPEQDLIDDGHQKPEALGAAQGPDGQVSGQEDSSFALELLPKTWLGELRQFEDTAARSALITPQEPEQGTGTAVSIAASGVAPEQGGVTKPLDQTSLENSTPAKSGVAEQGNAESVSTLPLADGLHEMADWRLPPGLLRAIHIKAEARSSESTSSDSGPPAANPTSQVQFFGVSSIKEIEIFLGHGTLDQTFARMVPEALKLDSIRLEHLGCGGWVVPLLASTQQAPQRIPCPEKPVDQAGPSTVAVMYDAFGIRRYFSGGHLESNGTVGDMGTRISLFRALRASPANSKGPLRFRHPGVNGATVELTKEVASPMPQGPEPETVAQAHRVFVVEPLVSPRPRASLRFAVGPGSQQVDVQLLGRLERAMNASFINAKAFVPVPWSALERQTGLSWGLLDSQTGGWTGTVLDYLMDYVLEVVVGAKGISVTWFDRGGVAHHRKNHDYLDGVPPELLARDIFDDALESMPGPPSAKTATRQTASPATR